MEAQNANKNDLQLEAVDPKKRIKQYRAIRAVCHEAKALRNQVIDIANFSNQGSEDSANFLNGCNMKFANKAFRRAAKIADGLVGPTAERKAMLKELISTHFQDKLALVMSSDALHNLLYLSDDQFKMILVPFVREANGSDVLVQELHKIRQKLKHGTEVLETFVESLSPSAERMVTSRELSEYLNSVFHGNRSSYMSLSSPWQHLEEWKDFKEQDFESTWEMLMYAGFVEYPIVLELSSASQMNPFLMQVSGLWPSLSDSASICCANQAEIPVYGPEGGKPVQDILTLIDSSMPRTSKIICSGKLLGEKYTSAVVLQIYSGFKMQIALHSNSVFHLIAVPEGVNREDVIANLHRAFMGRAFMCGSCSFGTVDHVACSDLINHHGQQTSARGPAINNACPRCGWFSPTLSDWEPWDGNV